MTNAKDTPSIDITVLDESIVRGIADADAGRVKSAAQVFDRLEAKYQAMIDLEAGQLAEIGAGLAEADRGEFAADAKVEKVAGKYLKANNP